MKRILHRSLNAIMLLLVGGSMASATTDVTLREQVSTSTSVVRLGDVAEVVGADMQQTRRLAALPLMPAPGPGATRFLRKREIEDLLAAHGVDLRELRINGAGQVTITAAGASGPDREDGSGSQASLTMNRRAAVLSGQMDPGSARKVAPARIAEPIEQPISMPVVVAVQPIARGEIFTAAQLELQTVDYVPKANHRRSAVDAVEKLIGMEARQPIQVGDIVFTDQVQAPVLVKRGDLVTVSSQASGIRVRTTARARQDASHGQLVQLESLETRERFDARVVGHREAAIVAITRPSLNAPFQQIETARR